MSQPPVVPYTPILRRYHEISALPEEQRLEEAKHLAADPQPLVDAFLHSIDRLAAGYSHQGTFRPTERKPKQSETPGINNANDLAHQLCDQKRLRVTNDPDLDVDWVNYELSILSTPGAAIFDEPKHGAKPGAEVRGAGRAIRADLVMSNSADHTPVLGEVKFRRDKDPFAALVQLLAYIAHLCTPSQYKRLRNELPAGNYPEALPPFDGYLVLYEFATTSNTWLQELMTQTELLAEAFAQHPTISQRVRRLACLDLTLGPTGELEAKRRWRYPS